MQPEVLSNVIELETQPIGLVRFVRSPEKPQRWSWQGSFLAHLGIPAKIHGLKKYRKYQFMKQLKNDSGGLGCFQVVGRPRDDFSLAFLPILPELPGQKCLRRLHGQCVLLSAAIPSAGSGGDSFVEATRQVSL